MEVEKVSEKLKTLVETEEFLATFTINKATKNEFRVLLRNYLASYGLSIDDFPFAIHEFCLKKWSDNESQVLLKTDSLHEMFCIMIIAAQSKEILTEYFQFLIKIFLRKKDYQDFSPKDLSKEIASCSENLLNRIEYLKTRTTDEILQRHHLISFEDNFAIFSAHQYLKEQSKIIVNLNENISTYVEYLDRLLSENLNILFDPQTSIEKKLLMRIWFIKDHKELQQFEFNDMISTLLRNPPKSIGENSLRELKEIANSKTIKEAIEIFIYDSLQTSDPPFSNFEKGIEMINEVFDWAVTQGKTYYANLLYSTRSYSVESYIYIHSNCEFLGHFDKTFKILAFIRECMNSYRKITDSTEKLIPYPINSFIIPGENNRLEDGSRFEKILFPNRQQILQFDTAIFLSRSSSWKLSLYEFQHEFNNLQETGYKENRIDGQPFLANSSWQFFPSKCITSRLGPRSINIKKS